MKNQKNNVFEQFITSLLNTHDGNDRLRKALSETETLHETIDNLLLESALDAFFIPVNHISDKEFFNIINKLDKLVNKLSDSILVNKNDVNLVKIIRTKYSSRKCLLSKEILLYLNKLYKKYDNT